LVHGKNMREILNNQNYRPIVYILGAYLSIIVGAFVFGRDVTEVIRIMNTLLAPACAMIALITALRALFGANQAESSPQIWGRVVTGLIFWTVAEAIWSIYFLKSWGKGPGTTAADALWLVGYIPLIEALVMRYQKYYARPGISRALGSILFALALLIPATYILLFPTLLGLQNWAQISDLLIKTTYSVVNIAILPFAVLILVTLGHGRLFRVWGLISISFILRAITYFLLTYLIPNTIISQQFSAIPTIIYSLIHLLLALGIYGSLLLGQQIALVSQLKLGFIGKEKEIPQFLFNTDVDGKIINISKNFLQFTNNSLLERYLGRPIKEALGLSNDELSSITDICSRGGFVINHDIRVSAGQKAPVPLLLTAVGSLTNQEYFGLDIVLQLPNYSAQAYPLDAESNAIIQSLLRRTGQQTKENSSYLAEYFIAHIRSFYELVNQPGSNLTAAAMTREINETAVRNKWPIRIAGHEVTIEPGFDNFDDAELLLALPVLYQIAEQFTIKATNAKAVAEQTQKADRLMSKNALLAAQNFGLRQR
jgi:hypothetical protein